MNVVEVALYQRLTSTTALTTLLGGSGGVYNGIAQPSAPNASIVLPYVVFNEQSGIDDNKSPHRARQLLYVVKAVSSKNMAEAGTIDSAIDAALHELPITVSGYTNVSLRREQDVRYTEVASDSKTYHHSGGVYRMRLAK